MKINLERHETCSRSVIHHSEKCVVLTFLATFPHCRREKIERWLLKCRARNVEGTVFTAKCKSKTNSSWAAPQPQVVTRQWSMDSPWLLQFRSCCKGPENLFLLASYCEQWGPPWSQHFLPELEQFWWFHMKHFCLHICLMCTLCKLAGLSLKNVMSSSKGIRTKDVCVFLCLFSHDYLQSQNNSFSEALRHHESDWNQTEWDHKQKENQRVSQWAALSLHAVWTRL